MSIDPSGLQLINRTGRDVGYVAFKSPAGYSIFMLEPDDVVTVYNVNVRTVDEESRLEGAGHDSQVPADGKNGRD